jgi:hypothetical protein
MKERMIAACTQAPKPTERGNASHLMGFHKLQYCHAKDQQRRIVRKHLAKVHQALIGIAQSLFDKSVEGPLTALESVSKCIFLARCHAISGKN